MRDLPSRESWRKYPNRVSHSFLIADAYADGVLKTRQEFIDSLDMTLLIDELQDLKAEYFNNAPCCQVDRTEALFDDAKRLLAAALGKATT